MPRCFVERMLEAVLMTNENTSAVDHGVTNRCASIILETWEVKGCWMEIEDLELLCERAEALKVVTCAVAITDTVNRRVCHVSVFNFLSSHSLVPTWPPRFPQISYEGSWLDMRS